MLFDRTVMNDLRPSQSFWNFLITCGKCKGICRENQSSTKDSENAINKSFCDDQKLTATIQTRSAFSNIYQVTNTFELN